MQSPSIVPPRFLACVGVAAALGSSPAFAQDGATFGLAIGANLSAGQAVPDGYDNADHGLASVDGGGLGGGGELLIRRPIGWSQLRAGIRGGYGKNLALFKLPSAVTGPVDGCDPATSTCETVTVPQGSLRGSAAYASGLVGGEIHLSDPSGTRPYLLGELGFTAAMMWPRARAENNTLNCAVSSACEDGDFTGEPETQRLAVGPAAVVGAGLALSAPVRIEASYLWNSLLGGSWSLGDGIESPKTSLSMVELSVGFMFGG